MQLNEAIRLMADGKDLDLVDLYALSHDPAANPDLLISSDGYHPSDLGYGLWADAVWSSIQWRVRAAS
jgi:lysophospholipase L1-like esterase